MSSNAHWVSTSSDSCAALQSSSLSPARCGAEDEGCSSLAGSWPAAGVQEEGEGEGEG